MDCVTPAWRGEFAARKIGHGFKRLPRFPTIPIDSPSEITIHDHRAILAKPKECSQAPLLTRIELCEEGNASAISVRSLNGNQLACRTDLCAVRENTARRYLAL